MSGEIRQFYHGHSDGSFTIRTYQDVGPHLKYAADMRRADREERGAFGRRRDWHHTMSVPVNVIYAVAERLGIQGKDLFGREEQRRIMSELKRGEFAGFRTTTDAKIGK